MMTKTDDAAMVTTDGGLPAIKETIGTTAWRARRIAVRSLGKAVKITLGLGVVAAGLLVVAALYDAARAR